VQILKPILLDAKAHNCDTPWVPIANGVCADELVETCDAEEEVLVAVERVLFGGCAEEEGVIWRGD
jgi:hypothetical protein